MPVTGDVVLTGSSPAARIIALAASLPVTGDLTGSSPAART